MCLGGDLFCAWAWAYIHLEESALCEGELHFKGSFCMLSCACFRVPCFDRLRWAFCPCLRGPILLLGFLHNQTISLCSLLFHHSSRGRILPKPSGFAPWVCFYSTWVCFYWVMMSDWTFVVEMGLNAFVLEGLFWLLGGFEPALLFLSLEAESLYWVFLCPSYLKLPCVFASSMLLGTWVRL